jgi:hypothetical protein
MSSTTLELRPLELSPAIYSVLSAPLKSSSASSTSTFPLTMHLLPKSPATHGQWRDALDAVQQRHPLLSACIDTTFNRVPQFRRVTGQRSYVTSSSLLRGMLSRHCHWRPLASTSSERHSVPRPSPASHRSLLSAPSCRMWRELNLRQNRPPRSPGRRHYPRCYLRCAHHRRQSHR